MEEEYWRSRRSKELNEWCEQRKYRELPDDKADGHYRPDTDLSHQAGGVVWRHNPMEEKEKRGPPPGAARYHRLPAQPRYPPGRSSSAAPSTTGDARPSLPFSVRSSSSSSGIGGGATAAQPQDGRGRSTEPRSYWAKSGGPASEQSKR